MKATSIRRITSSEPEKMLELLQVFHEAFESDKAEVTSEYLQGLLSQPHFWVYTFEQKSKVLGGFTGFVLPRYYQETAEFFIYDIAVLPSEQRKGIGHQLLKVLMDDCLKNGISEVFVDASEEDPQAIEFYRTFKGREEAVFQFSFRHL